MKTSWLVTAGSHITGIAQLVLQTVVDWSPLIVLALVLLAAGRGVRRWQLERRWEACDSGSRPVVIIPAPGASREGAHRLWAGLVRVLVEDAQVTWQYYWTGGSLEITVWVPWIVPDGTIRQLIEDAWPGAVALCSLPDEFPDGMVHARGGTLRPARPRRQDGVTCPKPDRLRELCSAAAALSADESAVVQILARPQAVRPSRFRRGQMRRERCTCPPADGCRRHGDAWGFCSRETAGTQPVWWNTSIQFLAKTVAEAPATPSWESIRTEFQKFAEGVRLQRLWTSMAAALSGKRRWRRGSMNPLDDVNNRRFRRGRLLSVPGIADLATLLPDPVLPGLNVESGSGNGTGTPS